MDRRQTDDRSTRHRRYWCSDVLQTIREILTDRIRSRECSYSGPGNVLQDAKRRSVLSEGSTVSSICSQENNARSLEKLPCNVQCYGRGNIHKDIAKDLGISQREGTDFPCILFVYKVSREIEDLRNALHWVTGDNRARKEDICAVILLEMVFYASPNIAYNVMIDSDLFHEGTKCFRILWAEAGCNWSPQRVSAHPSDSRTISSQGPRKMLPSSEDQSRPSEGLTACFPMDWDRVKKIGTRKDSPSYEFSKEDCFQHPKMDNRTLKRLRSDLCNYNPPMGCANCINILLFGTEGAGKSSVINTFFCALYADSRTKTHFPTGDNSGSPSQQLRSYKIEKFQFWELPGLSALKNTAQRKRVLQMILEGRVPKGTDLHDLERDCNVTDHAENPENVIHGIALIFDLSTEDISDDTTNQFQEVQRLTAQKYIYTIVIGTKFDLLDIDENDHERIYEYRPLREKFQKLSNSTKIDKHFMFALSNQWRSNMKKTECILALYALDNMVRNIDKYLRVSS